jgi:hypothetical protein
MDQSKREREKERGSFKFAIRNNRFGVSSEMVEGVTRMNRKPLTNKIFIFFYTSSFVRDPNARTNFVGFISIDFSFFFFPFLLFCVLNCSMYIFFISLFVLCSLMCAHALVRTGYKWRTLTCRTI